MFGVSVFTVTVLSLLILNLLFKWGVGEKNCAKAAGMTSNSHELILKKDTCVESQLGNLGDPRINL